MPQDPLSSIESLDAELFKLVRQASQFAMADGALPKKVKFLIAMALDASLGHASGVASLARAAMGAGATKQEIAEALRVANYIAGAACTYTAAHGLAELEQKA